MRKILILLGVFCYFPAIGNIDMHRDNFVDESVVDILKKTDFNMELFELAFCINEIHYLVESDSVYYELLKKRFSRFSSIIEEDALKYMHILEYRLFKQQLDIVLLNKGCSVSLKDFQKIGEASSESIDTTDFSIHFKSYIEYPEQVDNACLITLLSDVSCDYFSQIQDDKIALWQFNNWLDYGFEEFRYYPGVLKDGLGVINNRIIDYILELEHCPNQKLVHKSKAMFESIRSRY